jgi:hypothetical protein
LFYAKIMPVLINRLLRRNLHRGPEHTTCTGSRSSSTAAKNGSKQNASIAGAPAGAVGVLLLVDDDPPPNTTTTPPHPEKVDNDDDDDDADSLLSEPEWREYWEKPDYGSLAGYFEHRDRLLRRILRSNQDTTENNTNPSDSFSSFGQQLWRRERAVRLLHTKYVQQQQQQQQQQQSPRRSGGGDDDHKNEEEEDERQPQHNDQEELTESLLSQPGELSLLSQDERTTPATTTTTAAAITTTTAGTEPSSPSCTNGDRSWRDVWTFECHSSIPAICCLFLHCLAHSALDDLVRSLFLSSGMISLVVLLCAVMALRLTGDLYWWLDDDTYDVLRVDFDNRRRLDQHGDVEMVWSGRVRRWPIVRAIFFMVGYCICYSSATSFSESLERNILFQASSSSYASIQSKLPSKLHEEQYGTCPTDVSFCSTACHDYRHEQGKVIGLSRGIISCPFV